MSKVEFERDVRNGILISILAFMGWLAFVLVHTFTWSPNFTFFQNIIIAFGSFLIVGFLVGAMWMSGAKKYGDAMEEFFKKEVEGEIEHE